MGKYTYAVIVKPKQGNNGVLGIEYWFPDFEECEHIFFPGSDESITTDMTQRFLALIRRTGLMTIKDGMNHRRKTMISIITYLIYFLFTLLCAIAVRAYFDSRGE